MIAVAISVPAGLLLKYPPATEQRNMHPTRQQQSHGQTDFRDYKQQNHWEYLGCSFSKLRPFTTCTRANLGFLITGVSLLMWNQHLLPCPAINRSCLLTILHRQQSTAHVCVYTRTTTLHISSSRPLWAQNSLKRVKGEVINLKGIQNSG